MRQGNGKKSPKKPEKSLKTDLARKMLQHSNENTVRKKMDERCKP